MSAELVAIELQVRGYEGVMSDMRMLDTMLNNLRGRKNKIQIQNNLAKAKKDVIAYRAEVERLSRLQSKITKGMASGALKNPAWSKRLAGVTKDLETMRRKLKDSQTAVNEFQYALKNLAPPTFGQVFGKISSWAAHLGSAMQSFGNALTRMTAPFRRFTTGLIYSAGYKALNMITEGFSGAFERYDTMQTYAKSLKELGLDADQTFKVFSKQEKAMTAIDNLNESVLGLPTGLDEIVAAQKVYAGSTGEMVKSTKLAIAANNTFISSTMGAREQRFMQRYLASLASGADLTTTQWQSIGRIAPLALNAVAEELEVTTDDLRNGRVEGEKFLEAFMKVGTEGKIQAAANVMKTTWEGLTANIQNATKRMGEGLLKALDEAFEGYNGRNFVQNLLGFDAEGNEIGGGIKHFINDISDGLQKWVKAHPQEIMDFFNALKSVNWKSILKGIGEGFLELANFVEKVAGKLEGKDLSNIGKFMVMGNVWGRLFTVAGGIIKGSRHIIGLLGAAGVIAFLKARGFSRYGLTGMLGNIIGGTAAGAAETATVASTTARTVPKLGKFSAGLSSVFKGWAQISTMILGSAFTAWGSMKLVKGAIKSFKETTELLGEIDWDRGAELIIGMGTFFTAMGGLSALAGGNVGAGVELLIGEAIVGLFTTIATGFAAIDMKLVKSTVKDLNKTVGYLTSAIEGLNELGEVADVKTALDRAGKAVEVFNDIRDLFKGKYDHFSGEMTSGLKGFGKGTTKSVKNIADTIGNLKKAITTLNEFSNMDIDTEGIQNVAHPLQEALSELRSAILAIPSEWKESGIVDATSNLDSSLANLKSSFQNIVGKNGLLGMIPKLVAQIEGADQSGDLLELPGKMKKLGETLKQAYNALNSGIGSGDVMTKNLDNFRTALKSAKFAVKHLQELGGMEVSDDAVTNIKGIFDKIKEAFNIETVTGIADTINTFKQSIKDALDSFQDLNEDIEINPKVKLGSGFQSSVNSSVSQIKKAKGKIDNAVDSIPSNYYKTVSVHVAVNAVVSGIGAATSKVAQGMQQIVNSTKSKYGSTGGQFNRNGVLYRGGGGSVFKPRGRDTVPAMLAPGEYVTKKRAVDFFGIDFMRKVNNMDVRGAMNALLTRGGTNIGVGRQSVMNSTVNNNQRVNMTVNTNNPNFATMRMGRFVGAL